MPDSRSKLFGGILLVAGTSIGAGMLALPITTGSGGFYAAAIAMVLCFSYMLCSLFILLEANLYSANPEANIITMSKQHLGWLGSTSAWLSFLLLLYAVSAAYISGGGALFSTFARTTLHTSLSPHYGALIFALVFGCIAYVGITWIDRINRLLMVGLIVSYFATVFFVAPKVTVHHLNHGHPKYLLAAIPIILLSFTSHIIVPSLRTYFYDHVPSLKKVLFFGSLVPLVFYVLWDFLLLGALPVDSPYSLEAIAKAAHPLTHLSEAFLHLKLPLVATSNGFFSFFAMVTSFLGVILSLCDFLADGFHIPKNRKGRLTLLALCFGPPLLFALFSPSGFVIALGYAGIFVAILYGILPARMVWKARYQNKLPAPDFFMPGGKVLLAMMMLIAVAVIGLQIGATHHWLPAT